ncbi:MAG: hypothetical protein LBT40_01770, partial [Deltaproteobacteria bacterium]|nr:hypothetical protein [Deltaproteobacteria bacterium]
RFGFFIQLLRDTGDIEGAMAEAGADRDGLAACRRASPEFGAALAEAMRIVPYAAEAELMARVARMSRPAPPTARGRKADPAWTRKLPSSALIWILAHMHPDYGGPSPAPEPVPKTHVPLKDLSRAELKKLAEIYDWLKELVIRQAPGRRPGRRLTPQPGGGGPTSPPSGSGAAPRRSGGRGRDGPGRGHGPSRPEARRRDEAEDPRPEAAGAPRVLKGACSQPVSGEIVPLRASWRAWR